MATRPALADLELRHYPPRDIVDISRRELFADFLADGDAHNVVERVVVLRGVEHPAPRKISAVVPIRPPGAPRRR
jgi:hypothetical protein